MTDEEGTIFKVKAFMDYLKSDGFSNLCDPILSCIPYHYEDEVWEFELIIRKVKKVVSYDEEFSDVEVNEVKPNHDRNKV